MIVDIYQSDSDLWHIIDKDTGKEIRGVQCANDENGNYITLRLDKNGEIEWCKCKQCGDSHPIIEKKHGNIELIRKCKEEQNG